MVAIALCVVFLNPSSDSYRKELSNSEKELLVEKAYQNFAWGYQYRGQAIFNDGTIYEWNLDGKDDTSKDNKTLILEKGKKLSKKVTEKDLETIEKNIKELKGTVDRKNTANDAGANYISVQKDGKTVVLKESGDFTGENKDQTAQEIIKIAENYLK